MEMKKTIIFLTLFVVLTLCSCKKDEFSKFGEEYVPEYDDNQSAIKELALKDSLLYVSNADFLVYALDLEQKEYYPVCSKPDCNHTPPKCNAFVQGNNLCSYQDELIINDANKIYFLRTDGTGGEEKEGFFEAQGNGNGSGGGGGQHGTPIAHRGYLYAGFLTYTEKETIFEFSRIPIRGGKKEIIYQKTYPIGQVTNSGAETIVSVNTNYGFNGYFGIGSKVYFSTCQTDGWDSRIFCYDTKKKDTSVIYEGRFNRFYPKGKNWYLRKEDGMYCWNSETGEERCLYTFTEEQNSVENRIYPFFYQDGFGFYQEKDSVSFWFYDWEGEFVKKVELSMLNPDSSFSSINGNYENYLVCCYRELEHYVYAVLDTNQLKESSPEWILFSMPDMVKVLKF